MSEYQSLHVGIDIEVSGFTWRSAFRSLGRITGPSSYAYIHSVGYMALVCSLARRFALHPLPSIYYLPCDEQRGRGRAQIPRALSCGEHM
jgi:hypothetical protein